MRSTVALAALVTLGVLVAPSPATAAPNAAQVDADAVRAALVNVHSVYASGVGVQVGDEGTIIFRTSGGPDAGRAFRARPLAGGREVEAAARVSWGGGYHALVLRPQQPLGGAPLPVSDKEISLGQRVFVPSLRHRGGPRPVGVELIETTVSAVSPSVITLGASGSIVPYGLPVLDESGAVLAVVINHEGAAVRVGAVLDPAEQRERGMGVTPLIGVRLGVEAVSDQDARFLLSFEGGAALWDRLGILGRIGVGVGGVERARLAPQVGTGPGVMEYDAVTVHAALELKYRWLLYEDDGFPVYLSLSAAGQYYGGNAEPRGMAFYSGNPGCDPTVDACPLTVRKAPELEFEHAFGPTFGLDLTFGPTTLGYRYAPGALALDAPDHVHHITVGFGLL